MLKAGSFSLIFFAAALSVIVRWSFGLPRVLVVNAKLFPYVQRDVYRRLPTVGKIRSICLAQTGILRDKRSQIRWTDESEDMDDCTNPYPQLWLFSASRVHFDSTQHYNILLRILSKHLFLVSSCFPLQLKPRPLRRQSVLNHSDFSIVCSKSWSKGINFFLTVELHRTKCIRSVLWFEYSSVRSSKGFLETLVQFVDDLPVHLRAWNN